MNNQNYSCFNWSIEDVKMQLQNISDEITKDHELSEEDKENILDEAICNCEDEIISLINDAIQEAIYIYMNKK